MTLLPAAFKKSLRGAQLRAHLVDELLHLAGFDADDVVLILEQNAERVGDRRGIEGGKAKELIDEVRAELRAAE